MSITSEAVGFRKIKEIRNDWTEHFSVAKPKQLSEIIVVLSIIKR